MMSYRLEFRKFISGLMNRGKLVIKLTKTLWHRSKKNIASKLKISRGKSKNKSKSSNC